MATNSASERRASTPPDRSLWRLAAWALTAAAAFHGAYAWTGANSLLLLYLFALLRLAEAPTWRRSFYSGLAVGLLIAAGRLDFFWNIFSAGAIGLWLVFAFWIGLFVALARLSLLRFGNRLGWLWIPVVWAGLEYFRSELYYLRFSWLSPGYGVAGSAWQGLLPLTGTYGLGLLLAALACAAACAWNRSRVRSSLLLLAGAASLWALALLSSPELSPAPRETSGARSLPANANLAAADTSSSPTSLRSTNLIHIARIQMEFPSEMEMLTRLTETLRRHPDTDLLVLSEYTLTDQVPARVKLVPQNRRYLVVGGEEPAERGNFYNTAYVVGPGGTIEFSQAKAVPIQFFKDGLPAGDQKLWSSPWGKIGLCICYDLSYRRVVDRLVKLGAQALIVPTMDVADWGERQHRLHARVAPVRAAEYGIPIFRLASSGISQCVDSRGRVQSAAPFPGDGATLLGSLDLRAPGRLPLDHWLASFASLLAAASLCLGFKTRHARP